jgi:hypothetical protein
VGTPGTTVGGAGPAVLEDPTGTRARWLRRAGRVVFLVFLGWLLSIVLGGLGLVPVAGIPLAHVLRPSQGPPPLAKLPKPRQPSPSDLRPAVPAKVFAAAAAAATAAADLRGAHLGSPARTTPTAPLTVHGKSGSAPGRTKTTPALAAAHGQSAVAPGQTKTTSAAGSSPGNSAAARAKVITSTVPHRRSVVAPGQTKTTTSLTTSTVSHGRSWVAPGQTTTSLTHSKKP